MPVWSVSEPYISLWLHDEPLGYQPTTGPRISFELAFKQRELTAGLNTNIFSIGKKWNCSWLSFVTQDSQGSNVLHFPEGKQVTFAGTNDYLTNTRLTGNTNTGFTLLYPDGSQNVYGFIVTNSSGVFQQAFLTESWNPAGQKTRLYYSGYNPSSPVVRLQSIVDGDGRTNSILYVSSNAYSTNLISQVTDPFGRMTTLRYDGSGHLTNIVDVAGNTNSLLYGANDWVTSLGTPYGTTSFTVTDTSGTNVSPNGRSVLVTQPDGGHQLYLYQDYAPGVVSAYPTNAIPYTGALVSEFDNLNLQIRNSFHWGARQYAALSTTTMASFTSNDFLKAAMNHWLMTSNNSVGETISFEREPSTDSAGTIEGQKTWYDYAGKINSSYQGTQVQPLFVARVLPDGTTSFTRTDRNSFGAVTNEISTYTLTAGGAALLRTNSYVYDVTGVDLLAKTNALGVLVSSNVYNAFNEVLTNYDASNEVTAFTYDASNRVTSVKRPTGLLTTNIYGTDGFLAQQIDIGFATNAYTYTNALVYTHTDPRGLVTTNTWDALNRLTSTAYPDGSTISNRYTILDVTATKDRLGNWTYFSYDSLRRKIAETNVLNQVTLYNYCTCGSLDSIVDAMTDITSFNYDNQGNPTNVAYADGYSVTRVYDLLRRVVSTSDSGGNNVTNTFNNQGLVISVTNTVGRVQGTVYDLLDRATNSVDANGVSLNTTYDNLNRPLNRSYPDNGVEHWAYTLNVSGATSYTNQITNVVSYAFDAMNRKTNEVYVDITTNKFVYNGASDLLTLTDGKNQTTTWGYDSFGRVTNKVDAANNILFVYQYDANNRLTNRYSLAKGPTVYRYDPLGNLTNVDYSGGTVTMPSVNLAYDKLNRLTNMVTSGTFTNNYSYDAVGQLLSEGGLWPNDTVSYTYANRLRNSLSVQAPNSSTWNQGYAYAAARRLTSLTSPAGAFGYIYDPIKLQRVDELTLPNGAYITNIYDSVARELSTVLKTSGNTVLDSESYGYNQGNQRLAETNTAGDFRTYTYDNIGELTTTLGKEAGGVTNRWQEQFGYVYDAAGNLNYRTNNALVQTFSVNNLNELTTTTNSGRLTVTGTTTSPATNVTVNTSNAVLYADITFASTNQPWVNGNNTFTAIAKDAYGRTNTNSVTVMQATNIFAYDYNGNLLSDGRRGFDYDDENQLIRVTVTNSWKSEFTYDGKLRRRVLKEFTWNGSSWTQTDEVHYIYDGNVVVQERDANNLPKVTYTRGNDLSGTLQGAGGIGGLLARSDNTQLIIGSSSAHAYYHADGNGNVTMLINNLQLIVAKYLYDPFGNMLSMSGSLANANIYRFSSKEWNDNPGLYYYLYRFYDPNLQRWPNRDPIEERGGKNLYRFVGNDPIHHVDMLGLQSVPVSLTEALASGNVAQVESILAGMEEGDAGYALAEAWLKKVAKCEAIWAAYKALNCTGCSRCTTKEQAIANAACLTLEIAGRAAYLKLKCDYCLAESIARGSAVAEKGHQTQLVEKTAALANCTAKSLTLPSTTPPVPPAP